MADGAMFVNELFPVCPECHRLTADNARLTVEIERLTVAFDAAVAHIGDLDAHPGF